MSNLMKAHCPECGAPIPPPTDANPTTVIICASCGNELGTVGDSLKAAHEKLTDAFGEILEGDTE
jgi:uncharacterized Zn finger protein (UPF0148 family)